MKFSALAAIALTVPLLASCSTPSADYKSEAAPSPAETTEAPVFKPAPSPSPPPPPSPSPVEEIGTPSNPLAYGAKDTGSTWEITVDSVNSTDANVLIEAENEFNEPPTNGQYVLVTVTGTNISPDVASLADLSPQFVGADSLLYDETYFVVTPNAASDLPQVLTGNFVYDVPPEAVGNGSVALIRGDDTMRVWASNGVTP